MAYAEYLTVAGHAWFKLYRQAEAEGSVHLRPGVPALEACTRPSFRYFIVSVRFTHLYWYHVPLSGVSNDQRILLAALCPIPLLGRLGLVMVGGEGGAWW